MNLMSALGYEAWRVDLIPLAQSNYDHLSMYYSMDISLDPFPYAGELGFHQQYSLTANHLFTSI